MLIVYSILCVFNLLLGKETSENSCCFKTVQETTVIIKRFMIVCKF